MARRRRGIAAFSVLALSALALVGLLHFGALPSPPPTSAVTALPAAPAGISIQKLIDATPPGGTVTPPPGRYEESLVIRKPITLDGRGEVQLDAGGEGSVIRLLTDGATITGLELRGSGESHDRIDSGVQVRGDHNRITDNRIEDCLFGVDLGQSNENLLQRNRISSKPLSMGLRGDGIRLWYSRENQILDNELSNIRDVVVWYSEANVIARNSVTGARYALHFMYSKANRVEENHYFDNMVGIFLMYSDGVRIERNRITDGHGATAMGIGFKESSDVVIRGNVILNYAKAIYLDISPYEPDTINLFEDNQIGYNGAGILFHNDWHSNVFRRNDFHGNFTQVAVRGGGSANRNTWEDNHWDDYEGFDRDGDGYGDTPYELYAYADRFWVDMPPAAFFRGSPLFEAIDFLDRLAPFTDPTLIVRDEQPRFRAVQGAP
ncbi:MAG: nitrous oxide reductase family maturation protein NosD [Deltaproteobacteria bacterium]|nr:nitrous oxide reductase family maturation protein NosD [Deltaproteobacteria bacterium]MBW2419813.1 nitrous oxide reductase family maturation protein NosD [Deltaproteobacteria bacterium]